MSAQLPSREEDAYLTRTLDADLRLVRLETYRDRDREDVTAVEIHEWVAGGESYARYEDGTGIPTVEVWWSYDDHDRWVGQELWSAALDRWFYTTRVYDAHGELYEERLVVDPPDAPEHVVRSAWLDGRVVRQDELDGGTPSGTRVWTYDAPAPALDHTETFDAGVDGSIDVVTRRIYGADARLEAETAERPAVGSTETTTYEWTDRGWPLSRRTESSPTVMLWTWSHDDAGRTVLSRFEQDNDGDGLVDAGGELTTEWACVR